MLWTPDRRLWTPSPSWRQPRGTRRTSTVGDPYEVWMLDASGRRILNSSGQVSTACQPYVQCRQCRTGSYVGVWLLKSSITFSPYIFYWSALTDCLSASIGDNESTSPPVGDTKIDAIDYVVFRCVDCLFTQARKCSCPNAKGDVDLWLPPGTTLPIYFNLGGVNYYADTNCNQSTTPGTIATGYTTINYCPQQCVSCSGAHTPCTIRATFSGITSCTGCVGNPSTASMFYNVSGVNFNGTYDCTLAASMPNPCQWQCTTSINVTRYPINGCSGTPTTVSATLAAYVGFQVGTGVPYALLQFSYGGDTITLFENDAIGSANACYPWGTKSGSNILTCGSASVGGTGGSVTAVEI